ncbi:phosphoribosylformylglycinamidine synthase subunit PurS [Acidobacteriota bacterium]
MNARIFITFKRAVLEPQGKAVKHSLHTLGFTGVEEVRVGRLVDMGLKAGNREEAEKEVNEMCTRLLVNATIEDYTFELYEASK